MSADFFAPAAEPKTPLGRFRILSSTAGVRVSPLQLGAMSIGDAWSPVMGSMTKDESFRLLDAFVEAGGNFIDTANHYQNEQSENWIGEWMATRKIRDRIVLATKYTSTYRDYDIGKDSLKKLQTDYVDILYLHWWDHSSSIGEIMNALHILVEKSKVLYLGVSDTPAWIVSAANEYAVSHGKTPFSIYQGEWNIMLRDFERDILPMARHYGMALAPWGVIAGGKFQTKSQLEERKEKGEGLRSFRGGEQSEQEANASAALEKVANELGGGGNYYSISAVALAYVMAKAPRVFPIVGGRKVEHLQDNIKALEIKLTHKQIEELESATGPFDVGFPGSFVGEDPKINHGKGSAHLASAAFVDWLQTEKPIGYT